MSKNRSTAVPEMTSKELEALPATFLRINAREVMERVKFGGKRFLIATFGHPMAVLISYEDYLCVRNYLPVSPAAQTASSVVPADSKGDTAVPGQLAENEGEKPGDLSWID